jgi:hypothetical protein
MTTPIDPGPESIGIAMGVSEMSGLVLASLLSAGVMRLSPVTMPQAVLATISPPAIFSTGQRNAEQNQHETSKEKKDHQNGDHVGGGFQCRVSALGRREIRGQGKEHRNRSDGVHDGEQREERSDRR